MHESSNIKFAYDANNAPFIEHDVTFPIQKKRAASKYDGGESMEEIFDRLEALTKKAEEMAKEALQNTNKQKSSLDKASAAFNALSASKDRLKGNLPEAEQHRQ
jgi:phosphoribosylaminoimidazole carboxylase (NCAIR synthetase)